MPVRIESLTHHGMGRGADGELYDRALPGELVERLPTGTVRILSPSPDRVTPPCPHFRTCGGCAMQHLRADRIADWKAGIVRRALDNQGLAAEIGPVLTSPPQSRRRAKLAGRRTKAGPIVGFHGRGSGTITAIPECRLLSPALMVALPALAEVAGLAATRSAEAALAVTATAGGPDLAVVSPRAATADIAAALAATAEAAGLSRLTWNGETVVLRRPPEVRLGPARVTLPPGAFLQATEAGEAALVAAVLAGTEGAGRVADLFAGCGTFALPLSARAGVHAVEGDGAMLEALEQGWRRAGGLNRLTAEPRDLFRRPLRAEELAAFDAVVIDPPRAGAEAQVRLLAESRVGRVTMVSCNPATFARDARLLIDGGFRAGPVTVIDQFLWSPHVELVCNFTRL